jgi:hypothetical protein
MAFDLQNTHIGNLMFIGYVFGSDEVKSAQSGVLEAMFSTASSTPIVSIAKGRTAEEDQKVGNGQPADFGGLFNVGPTHTAIASALAKFLRQMRWTYVNIVLDRSDDASMAIYKEFERISMGICTAELTIIGDDGVN